MGTPNFLETNEERTSNDNNAENFRIEDYLNLPNEEGEENDANYVDVDDGLIIDNLHVNGSSTESSALIVGDSLGSISATRINHNSEDVQFSGGELCVPQDDVAQLEWMSAFDEDSYSNEEKQKLKLISGIVPQSYNSPNRVGVELEHDSNSSIITKSDVQKPTKARSKRPRSAPYDWSSRVFPVSNTSQVDIVLSEPSTPIKRATKRKDNSNNGEGRKCLHCDTDKTPQWRTGPLGPKTLCNACGVRYKSGRLVPEYRPAASPTFMLTKHSNSHRKVMELRRQKDIQTQTPLIQTHHMQHQQHPLINLHEQRQGMIFDVSCREDYLIHHFGVEFGALH